MSDLEVESPHSKKKGLVWLLAFAGLAFLFALGLTWGARALPWSFEERLDRWAGIEETLKPCESRASPAAQAALKKLVARLFPIEPEDPTIPVQISVVSASEINAFASLNAKIFINQGLLNQAENAEEVAGVLAHEMEHVKRRHLIQNLSTQVVALGGLHIIFGGGGNSSELYRTILNMQFTKANEAEADRGGLERLVLAEIDPLPLSQFFERLAHEAHIPALISDHPDSAKRAELALQVRVEHPRPILSVPEWVALKNYCRP